MSPFMRIMSIIVIIGIALIIIGTTIIDNDAGILWGIGLAVTGICGMISGVNGSKEQRSSAGENGYERILEKLGKGNMKSDIFPHIMSIIVSVGIIIIIAGTAVIIVGIHFNTTVGIIIGICLAVAGISGALEGTKDGLKKKK